MREATAVAILSIPTSCREIPSPHQGLTLASPESDNCRPQLLHIDIDAFKKTEFPAAYFRHEKGLTLSEGAQLITALARDSRIRAIEISEYSSLRDNDLQWIKRLVDILAQALPLVRGESRPHE